MLTRHIFLTLAGLGLVLPAVAFAPWVATHGVAPRQFLVDLFANGVSAFFGVDVLVSALVLFFFVEIEGRRLGLRRRWLPVLATLLIGVSLGLPLFLYQRQAHLDRIAG